MKIILFNKTQSGIIQRTLMTYSYSVIGLPNNIQPLVIELLGKTQL